MYNILVFQLFPWIGNEYFIFKQNLKIKHFILKLVEFQHIQTSIVLDENIHLLHSGEKPIM